ncbi:MAG TPA: TonB-dependent siderophore receptor [Lysobacter sp.]
MSRLPALAPLAGALALALSLPALAEPALDAADLDTVRVYGHADGYQAEVTRTATKTDTKLVDVPQSITVVTDELIRDQAMTGMADVVRYVPGVGIAQGEGHRDAPIFRGNVSTSDFYIDGVRDDVQYVRDLYNVAAVEVLRGANSMIFGRGGSGGVINRVTKVADWQTRRGLDLQLSDQGRQRLVADFDQPVNDALALRVTALYEDSDSFRDGFSLKREAVNPTLAVRLGGSTLAWFGYERFRDERTTDRGVPSYNGRPLAVDTARFFGNPELSPGEVESDAFTAVIEHDFSDAVRLRNATRYADYSKFYQNVFPGAVNADATTVQLAAYNSATDRTNLFNQTDLTLQLGEGTRRHTVLVGAEFGRQETDNARLTGYFGAPGSTATSATVLVSNPRTGLPVTFRPSPLTATGGDADNSGVARNAAVYVQDQIEFSPQWQAVFGLRWDRFSMHFRDNRRGTVLESGDDRLSPRAGLIYKPAEPMSIYASYSRAFTPRAGEQLSSLTASTRTLAPESFENYEIGAKWDLRPDLSATAAVYRLERGNVVVQVPGSSLTQLVDAQVSRGVELGLSGRVTEGWSVMGGYAYQEGEVTRPTRSELAQLPRHSASLWNRYDFNPMWGVGLGAVYRDAVFATTSNTVVLPAFTRVDAAVFFTLNENLRMQLNVENLTDKTYYASAHNNDNIMPGAPRTVTLGLNLRF